MIRTEIYKKYHRGGSDIPFVIDGLGRLKIGDNIIPQKKFLVQTTATIYNTAVAIYKGDLTDKTFEIEVIFAYNGGINNRYQKQSYFCKMKFNTDRSDPVWMFRDYTGNSVRSVCFTPQGLKGINAALFEGGNQIGGGAYVTFVVSEIIE